MVTVVVAAAGQLPFNAEMYEVSVRQEIPADCEGCCVPGVEVTPMGVTEQLPFIAVMYVVSVRQTTPADCEGCCVLGTKVLDEGIATDMELVWELDMVASR